MKRTSGEHVKQRHKNWVIDDLRRRKVVHSLRVEAKTRDFKEFAVTFSGIVVATPSLLYAKATPTQQISTLKPLMPWNDGTVVCSRTTHIKA
jgi:hypothetical protein